LAQGTSHNEIFAPMGVITPPTVKASARQVMKNPHACTEIGLSSLGAASPAELVWKDKSELRVRFLDGSPEIQQDVRRHAYTWNKYTGIRFVFVDSGSADIGVSFTPNGRSWSYIGNSAERVNAKKPTMNFGWFDKTTTEEEFRRTTLHEFGHALGLIHEHQSPGATIKWNESKVYKYYEEYFEWNVNVVNDNIFAKYAGTRTQYGRYDPTSIMHYPIPAEFTTDGTSVG
jgi:predicted Zn-dependent protease